MLLHRSSGPRFYFFDDDDASNNDMLERDAEQFALDALISDREWGECMSRVTPNDQSVRSDAARLAVVENIVAGRIRRESVDSSFLGEFVGDGTVLSQFDV